MEKTLLRELPSVDEVSRSPAGEAVGSAAGQKLLTKLVRETLRDMRQQIVSGQLTGTRDELLHHAQEHLRASWQQSRRSGIRRVINATGVILHTNLGRAPLSKRAVQAMAEASGYCTLEYDASVGSRRHRGTRAEMLLQELTGAEEVLIVNNCAAAALFVLTVFAAGGEVIVSRGELVEIGGDFRIPDVLAQSGAALKEVGTTNRTRLSDFENAIDGNTRLLMRVHPSNYRIVGFAAAPPTSDLAAIAHKTGLLLYEDLGSGAVISLTKFGVRDEPTVADSLSAGVDIVTFSGDKLLGGPQAGIIVGRSEVVQRLRHHPLYRALRVDKLVLTALEATLESYAAGRHVDEVPLVSMLAVTAEEIERRASTFVDALRKRNITAMTLEGTSALGGGSAPMVELPTTLVALASQHASRLERELRLGEPPVIARILDDQVVIDLRAVSPEDGDLLLDLIAAAFTRCQPESHP